MEPLAQPPRHGPPLVCMKMKLSTVLLQNEDEEESFAVLRLSPWLHNVGLDTLIQVSIQLKVPIIILSCKSSKKHNMMFQLGEGCST